MTIEITRLNTVRNRIFLVVMAVAAVCITLIGSSLMETNEPPLSIGRGRSILIFRLPEQDDGQQYELTFFDVVPDMEPGRRVQLLPVYWRNMKEYPITTATLTSHEWEQVKELVTSLCHSTRASASPPQESEYLQIAMMCGRTPRYYTVMYQDASDEVRMVMNLAPVPHESNTSIVPNIIYP